jgi:hypothetical protein
MVGAAPSSTVECVRSRLINAELDFGQLARDDVYRPHLGPPDSEAVQYIWAVNPQPDRFAGLEAQHLWFPTAHAGKPRLQVNHSHAGSSHSGVLVAKGSGRQPDEDQAEDDESNTFTVHLAVYPR